MSFKRLTKKSMDTFASELWHSRHLL